MKMTNSFLSLAGVLALSVALSSCGPRAFTKGEYSDPEEVILLDDKFNENDMQLMSNTLIESLEKTEVVRKSDGRPIVMIGNVRNRTSEHVDMKLLTDKIRTALIKSGKLRFVDKDAREELKEEYTYQAGQFVDQKTAQRMGRQLGVQYIINGDLGSNVQQVGRDKVIYYKLTMNLIDVETSIIEWAEDREVRKLYRKRSIRN